MNRIEYLENEIRKHNDLYWNGKELEVSDVEYDKLVKELSELDPNNELVQNFAVPNMSNEKLITHSHPMLSLEKIYSSEELAKWIKKVSRSLDEKFIVQPKYDGMSGILENGTLSSRGDGIKGQDYTNKLCMINFETTRSIDPKKDYMLGEIIIRNSDFNDIFPSIMSKAGIPFKNQRNGIAGILGTDDVDFYKNQGAIITFVDYDINSIYTTAKDIIKDWESIAEQIQKCDYPLDGIVIKLQDSDYSASLGCTAHHPRGQVAFKFTNQKAISKLIDIEWSMGKKQLTAIGLIEPVELSGVTIKRVKLQLTKPKNTSVETCLIDGSLQIGDTVVVERAGDIIPHIISSTPGIKRQRVELKECPFCGSELFVNETSIQCADTNGGCIETYIQEVYNSVMTLGFKNVGEAYIRTIMTDPSLNVKNIADLMELKWEDLKLKEYGTRKKEIFFEEIEKAKHNATKVQVFASINLYGIGKTVSKLLIDNFDWNELINGKISKNQLLLIKGIGPSVVEVYDQLGYNKNGSEKYWTNVLNRMTKLFDFKEIKEIQSSNGLTICFTGKMEHKRSEMEAIASERGFIPMDKVDKTLNILVCADPNSGSSKLQKAAKYGTKIISEADFMAGNF